MSNFNIDIERHVATLKDQGESFKGFMVIQYPIYCVHSSIVDSTPDPLGKLDKRILEIIDVESTISPASISTFLGTSSSLILARIKRITQDGFLTGTEELTITKEGRNILIEGKQKRLRVLAYDFFVDGLRFKPLPSEYYTLFRKAFINEDDFTIYTDKNGETRTSLPFGPDLVHTPFEGELAKGEILEIDLERRPDFSIPEGLEEIKEVTFSKLTFPILISISDSEKVNKVMINGFAHDGAPILFKPFIDSLHSHISRMSFMLSQGGGSLPVIQSNWTEIDRKIYDEERIFFFSKEDFKVAIENLYRCKANESNLICEARKIGVQVTGKMLVSSEDRRKIVKALIRGRDYRFSSPYMSGVWLYFISFSPGDSFVEELIRLLRFIKHSDQKPSFEEIVSFNGTQPYPLRTLLVMGSELHLLEKMDIDRFMIKLE